MRIESRIKELGFTLPEIPAPVGAYVPAKRTGNLVYLSGQTCKIDGKPKYLGKVGAEVTLEQAHEAAQITALNLLACLKWAIGDLDRVVQIVNVHGWVACTPGFNRQPQVINGCSLLLEQVFGAAGKHSRTSLGTNELPEGIPVEIDMIVEVE